MIKTATMLVTAALTTAALAGTPVVSNYDDLTEGFQGDSFYYNGVTYSEVNNVDGVFPDGSTFTSTDIGDQVIIENAALFYSDFPDLGSPDNAMTFGTAFVPGDNLSLGAIATVTMDLDQPATMAQLNMAYYQYGPWGGIIFHLDAYDGETLVATDNFRIAVRDGRDELNLSRLVVEAPSFDRLHLYATFGDDFSAPRILMDNLSIVYATESCEGDTNGDNVVDLADLNAVLGSFGIDDGGDVNGDGNTDLADLNAVLGAFGTECN